MVVITQHEPLLAHRAPVSLQRQRVGGAGERQDCGVVLIGRCVGFAVKPPQPLSEVNGEQAVDERIQAGVEEPEDEQDVGQGVGDLPLQVVGEEPVPQAQQVVWSPADNERRDDHYT